MLLRLFRGEGGMTTTAHVTEQVIKIRMLRKILTQYIIPKIFFEYTLYSSYKIKRRLNCGILYIETINLRHNLLCIRHKDINCDE